LPIGAASVRTQLHVGLGIGLTLVKRLVELHGGTVSACSDGPGTGSSFTVRLALLDAAEPDMILPVSTNLVGGPHPHARILIADDNRDAARSLALMLAMEGYEVRTAYDGEEVGSPCSSSRRPVGVRKTSLTQR
jgi:hypothetical protein